jgi:hypothetical protein
MQLLFSSTSLQLHTQTLSNSFSDGEKTYSLSDRELKEYISNYPDLHINGVAYRLLTPEYYLWIRSQVCKVVKLYQDKKLTLEQIADTRENWKIVHQYAVENFNSKQIKNILDDILLQTQEGVYNYSIPVYDPKKEISVSYAPANAKERQSYKESKELCPVCNAKLSERQSKLGAITYNCFTCNDYCTSEPIADKQAIDKFAAVQPYCVIEFQGNRKTVTYPNSTPLPNERSESLSPNKLSFSRIPTSGVAAFPQGGQGRGTLSDVSKLTWPDMLLIFEQCQNDKELRKENFPLYLQVVALTGYRHTNKPEVPNIGSSIGLLQFLDSSREIIRKLIEGGYYSFDIDQTAPEAILAAT